MEKRRNSDQDVEQSLSRKASKESLNSTTRGSQQMQNERNKSNENLESNGFGDESFIPFEDTSKSITKLKEVQQLTNFTTDNRIQKVVQNEFNPTPWFRPLDPLLSPTKMLHEEILDFQKYIAPSQNEHKMRKLIISRITAVIKKLWPYAEVKIFGSFETQLYLPTSDIDMVVLLSDWVKDPPLHILANELQRKKIGESFKVIDRARVPIIKMKDSIVGFDVDISFNMKGGIKAAEIIKEKIIEFPALKPLTFVIKYFLFQRQLNEVFTGGLSSYAVTILIISLLQMHPKVNKGEIKADANLGVMLIEFFELYGRLLHYKTVGISIRNGGSYFHKASRYPPSQFHQPLISIEDPQDPENDISMSSFNFSQVSSSFAHAFSTLTTKVCEYESKKKPCKTSLLGEIIQILPEIIQVRRKVFDSAQNFNEF